MTWDGNVIGGIASPRALVCSGYNLIENYSFEDNLDDWTGTGVDYTGQFDSTAPHGSTVLEFEDSNDASLGAVYNQINIGEAIGGKTFVITFYVKNADNTSSTAMIAFETSLGNQDYTKTFSTISTAWRKITYTITWGATLTQQYFYVALFCREDYTEPNLLTRFDYFELYEVDGDYTLKTSNQFTQNYLKELNYSDESLDGRERESIKGWRYTANLNYQFLEAADAATLVYLSEASFIVFYPHSDHTFSVTVRWNGDFGLNYPWDRYLGHRIVMPLRGTELVSNKPRTTTAGESESIRLERTEIVF